MNRTFPPLALFLWVAACVSAPAIEPTPYPFAGTWDCEVATFTFSGDSYNNGSESLPIANVAQQDDNTFVLTLEDGATIALDMDGADRMQWLSGTTGDSFACNRL